MAVNMQNWAQHYRTTADGSQTLFHPEHQQLFHSKSGAQTEARSLYIEASGINSMWSSKDLTIADIGFGLGYNCCASITAWQSNPLAKNLRVISFEKDIDLINLLTEKSHPLQQKELEAFQSFVQKKELIHLNGSKASWQLIDGDLLTHDFCGLELNKFDYIWQDPFSPDKNPELWSTSYFDKICQHANDEALLMTYSVSRLVRDNLTASGFLVERIPTTTTKKHWLKAQKLSKQ